MGKPGAQELELKLSLPAAAVRRLAAHPLLRGAKRSVTRRLVTVYYDTPEFALRRRGLALRLRRDGRRWVQTLKGGGGAAGGLHQRLEIEREVPGEDLDFEMLAQSPYASLFTGRLRERLRPVFSTRFSRNERRLAPAPGLVVDAAVDRGEIVCGRRSEPLCELELEIRSGAPSGLYRLALALARDVPLVAENRSKAERGYALKSGLQSQPVKSSGAALVPAMTVAAAFRAIATAALNHLQANRDGTLAGKNPEYLHQMRVALRRMRSVFRVFAPALPGGAAAPFVEDMRWLAASLGPARDWDVFAVETVPRLLERMPSRAARSALARAVTVQRRRASRAARSAVESPRCRLFLLSLAGWLAAPRWDGEARATARRSQPVTSFAAQALERRLAKVRARGRRLASRPPAELHRLRIEIKKLRYAGSFFSALYDESRARRWLRRLSRLQDILGSMNDASQAARLLKECGTQMSDATHAEAGRALAAWARARAPGQRRSLQQAWRAFRGEQKPWRRPRWS